MEQETSQRWRWPDAMDAVKAAPESHQVLLENDDVRVLRIIVEPGVREPTHTHQWSSVMIVDQPARIRYYGPEGELQYESPAEPEDSDPDPVWMAPEGPHSVENIDNAKLLAYRIELKGNRNA